MKKTLLATFLFATFAQTTLATPKVASSIYPLQQIANAITGEKTDLVADSFLSPHSYTLKPSEVRTVLEADLFIWVGEVMMPQLDQFVDKRQDKKTITASTLSDIQLIKFGENHKHEHKHEVHKHEEHKHDGHKHNHVEHKHEVHKHEEHKHDGHKHNHVEHKHEEHNHTEHGGHNHDHSKMAYDPHIWLSTENAKVIATEIAKQLSQLDSENKAAYEKNLSTFIADLDATKIQILSEFESQPPKPYFIFHDAYRYFEKEFGVAHADKVRAHAGQAALTKHLAKLKKNLNKSSDACLFREPQFDSPLVTQLAKDTSVTVATLDPIGYDKEGKGYTTILKNIATVLRTCGNK